jgi:hypothetical protein
MNVVTPIGLGRNEITKMKTFTIDADNNITAYATRKAAEANPGIAFTTADNLAELLGGDSKRLIAIYNSLTGITPVKKFTSNAVASKRILAELDKLEPVPCQTAPGAGQAAQDATEQAPAKSEGTRKKKAPKAARKAEEAAGPREGSKTSKVIDLLRREGGATLTEIMKKMGWQQHTTRALMSGGGALAKKHGLIVKSAKAENGDRIYSL